MKPIGRFLPLVFIAALALGLSTSLGLKSADWVSLRPDWQMLARDFVFSWLRVTGVAVVTWVMAIVAGWGITLVQGGRTVSMPVVHFLRHISPFAWFPFAVVWFGIGDGPLIAVLGITLFFPGLVMSLAAFDGLPREILSQADLDGAGRFRRMIAIETPMLARELIDILRVNWGLGWGSVVAAEMLGVDRGMGFRLLDFRYLLKYPDMTLYLLVLGIGGMIMDRILHGAWYLADPMKPRRGF